MAERAPAAEPRHCWASLPVDLVRHVADRIPAIKDTIRYRSVCRSWYTATADGSVRVRPLCLMLAEKKGSELRELLSLHEDHEVVELDLPELKGRRCWGSRFGWLMSLGLDHRLELFNPFSRTTTRLPMPRLPLDLGPDPTTARDLPVERVIFSSSPSSNGFFAIITNFTLLALAKPGDDAWTCISSEALRPVTDAIWFKGSLYIVNQYGCVYVVKDLEGPHPKAVKFAAAARPTEASSSKYLVDVGGHLFLLARMFFVVEPGNRNKVGEFEDEVETVDFDIFKLDTDTREWEQVTCIGDWAVFVGNNCSFSVIASDYPGCRPNCVYFTDDEHPDWRFTGGVDVGVYDIKTGEMDYYKSKGLQNLHSAYSPSFWIIAS